MVVSNLGLWYSISSSTSLYIIVKWGGARVSCSSLGVGASVQLTTEESQVLERPSSGIWRRMFF